MSQFRKERGIIEAISSQPIIIGNIADGEGPNHVVNKKQLDGVGRAKKTYKVLITQSGTGVPTVVVLENSLGTIVWTRNDVGEYYGTLSNAFTENKRFVMLEQNRNTRTQVDYLDVSTIVIYTYDNAGAASDNVFSSRSFLIEVYP